MDKKTYHYIILSQKNCDKMCIFHRYGFDRTITGIYTRLPDIIQVLMSGSFKCHIAHTNCQNTFTISMLHLKYEHANKSDTTIVRILLRVWHETVWLAPNIKSRNNASCLAFLPLFLFDPCLSTRYFNWFPAWPWHGGCVAVHLPWHGRALYRAEPCIPCYVAVPLTYVCG